MILNTKQDYLNYLTINPQKAKEELQQLLDLRFTWANVQVLLSKDGVIEDETHRIIENDGEYLYQKSIEDVNGKLFRIGFSVEEVEDLINES